MDKVKRYGLEALLVITLSAATWIGFNLCRTMYYDHIAVQQIIQLINQSSAQAKQAAPAPTAK